MPFLKVNEENVLSPEDEKLVNMYAMSYHTNCNAAEQAALTLLANEQLPVLNVPTLRELGNKAEFSQMIRLGKRAITSWHEYTLFLVAITDYVTCACCNTFLFELFETKHEWLRGIPSLLVALDSEWYRIFNFIHPTDLSMEQLTSVTKLYRNAVKRLTKSKYIHYMSGSMLMSDLCLKASKVKRFRSKNDMASYRAINFSLSNSLFKDVSNVSHEMKSGGSDPALNCAHGGSTLLVENKPPVTVPKQKKYTSDITKYMAKKQDRPLVNDSAKVYSIFDKGGRFPLTTANESKPEDGLITTNESKLEDGLITTNESKLEDGLITTNESKPEDGLITTNESKPEDGLITTNESKPEDSLITTNESKPEDSLITTNEKITVPAEKSCVDNLEEVDEDCLKESIAVVDEPAPTRPTVTEQDMLLETEEKMTGMDVDPASLINDVTSNEDAISQQAPTDWPETQTQTDVNISTPPKTADNSKPLLRLTPIGKLLMSPTHKLSPSAMKTSPKRISPNSLVGKTCSPPVSDKKNNYVISPRETVPTCVNLLSPNKKDGFDRSQITPVDKPIVAFVNLCLPIKKSRVKEPKVPTPVVAKKMNAFEMMMNRSKENSKRKSLFPSGAKY